jgi:hypothetical protein
MAGTMASAVTVPYCGNQDSDSHTSEDDQPDDHFDVIGMSYGDDDEDEGPHFGESGYV